MAQSSINTGTTGQPVHVRTTAGTVYSEVAVLGIDGSDNVVPATTTNGLTVDVTRVAGTILSSEPGTYSYNAGTAGTVTVANGATVRTISAYASQSGTASIQIFGGSLIPLAIGAGFDEVIRGNLTGPGTIVFASTSSYYVGMVS